MYLNGELAKKTDEILELQVRWIGSANFHLISK